MNLGSILVIDDDPVVRDSCVRLLEPEGYRVETAGRGTAGLELLETMSFDLVLTDLRMPDMDGLQVLRAVRERYGDVEVMIFTGHGTVATAVDAMRMGAFDYIEKPFVPDELVLAVGRAVERRHLSRENRMLRQELHGRYRLDNIVGGSAPMQAVFRLLASVTPTASTVLITGESGTGKELVARAIHHNSPRRGGPFVVVDCASIPETLMEAELFGHTKGAFTGAGEARPGLLKEAHGGTVFFDEIGNVPLPVQAKLLRFLQERRVRAVGDSREREVDVRLVAATNNNLRSMIQAGTFREDLFYRLDVFPIRLPALRDRREDIPLLAEHFLSKHTKTLGKTINGISAEAMNLLVHAEWPGNVRQLENAVQRAIILAREPSLGPEDFPEFAPSAESEEQPPLTSEELKERKRLVRERSVLGIERAFVVAALGRNDGNVSRAARDVGMQRPNSHALRRKHGINAANGGPPAGR